MGLLDAKTVSTELDRRLLGAALPSPVDLWPLGPRHGAPVLTKYRQHPEPRAGVHPATGTDL